MLTINDIESAIAASGQSWIPGETSVWGRQSVGSNHDGLFGLRVDAGQPSLDPAAGSFDGIGKPDLPHSINWRLHDGGRLSPIRDQGVRCGACVAFATISSIEARHWIKFGEYVGLSEAELFHCNGGSCDRGWGLDSGMAAACNGLALLASGPWTDMPKCAHSKSVIKVNTYSPVVGDYSRKRALLSGPVIGGMQVYKDFFAYQSGVYRHVAGELEGMHAVCIVGYDDSKGAWVARNSWGSGWGDGGYFHIGYGECDIEKYPFYSCETAKL